MQTRYPHHTRRSTLERFVPMKHSAPTEKFDRFVKNMLSPIQTKTTIEQSDTIEDLLNKSKARIDENGGVSLTLFDFGVSFHFTVFFSNKNGCGMNSTFIRSDFTYITHQFFNPTRDRLLVFKSPSCLPPNLRKWWCIVVFNFFALLSIHMTNCFQELSLSEGFFCKNNRLKCKSLKLFKHNGILTN